MVIYLSSIASRSDLHFIVSRSYATDEKPFFAVCVFQKHYQ